MSKYTTEVRFICESLSGYDESKGYNDIAQTIALSMNQIFDPSLELYDPEYKAVLFTKILKHYYFREIGFETVGLWKHYLNTTLSEILPYYNQLYKSALLEFNPFYDVDYITEHSGSGINDKLDNETSQIDNENKSTSTSSYSDIGIETGNHQESGTNKNINVLTGSTTNNAEQTTNQTNETTGTITDTGNTSGTVENETDTKTKTTTKDTGTVETKTTTSKELNDKKKQKYSDTPQGSIQNLENDTYLTNATIDEGTNTEETEQNNKQTNDLTSVVDGESSGNSKATTDMDTNNTQEIDTVIETKGNTKTIISDTTNNTVTDNSENTVNASDSRNSEKTGTKNDNITETGINKRTALNSSKLTSTEEYLQKVQGKTSGTSYSKMLMEYRDTFLNIDMMIIDELKDLFMLLW